MIKSTIKKFVIKYFENFAYFYKKLGYRIILRVILNISVGFLDGFGLAMFLPLLQMVDGSSKGQSSNLGNLDFLVKGMNYVGLEMNLISVLIVLCVFFFLKGLAVYSGGYYEVIVRQYFIKNTRQNLTRLMSQMSYKSFVVSDVGTIQNVLSAEVARISVAYQQYFGTVQQAVMVIVYMMFAFFVDAKFAVLICIGGALTNLVYKKVYTITKKASEKLTFESNFYQGLIIQYVNSFKYLKATGLLGKYNQKLLNTIEHIEHNNTKIGKLSAIVSATREPLLIVVVSGVILLQVNVLGGTLSTILVSMLFFYRALSFLMMMQSSYNGFIAVSGSMDNITAFENKLMNNKEANGTVKITEFDSEIKLESASFGYKDTTVLKNINISIPKNKTIAFVGESGSGKSTLVNVLAGLIPLDKGSMTVNGINSLELDIKTFQKRIGYITQDPVIFTDTVFNNITFWDEPSPKSYDKFKIAVKQASVEDFLAEMPQKENTVLGNNGVNLSGGQRQRISIARELYKDVDILILDEATSALDSETEKAIQNNIESLHGKYTVLIVAHRLSTIKNADLIVVMNNGEIVESGSFSELMETSVRFKRMTQMQEL
ncbi:ABC transporter ATP-binding protein [Flavobacterium subsaxonicum]|uniref:ABC transporter ATP-binding protein n=1 Tax=Flavobacterium subsaxonicum WB 4.1-42 = DSM 21790 TaxID=1121898 RepID=A0A0A2MM13_9FLAO|nr:ABC transporter ATP-binding protein [Flavobacterium subsaxonicum]KGO93359.1 hypothetical protein Q766_08630 [Flavobacterium subsaxonicum WB 4.1-42 = DSM 21790]